MKCCDNAINHCRRKVGFSPVPFTVGFMMDNANFVLSALISSGNYDYTSATYAFLIEVWHDRSV
jgi:hypothetical protein